MLTAESLPGEFHPGIAEWNVRIDLKGVNVNRKIVCGLVANSLYKCQQGLFGTTSEKMPLTLGIVVAAWIILLGSFLVAYVAMAIVALAISWISTAISALLLLLLVALLLYLGLALRISDYFDVIRLGPDEPYRDVQLGKISVAFGDQAFRYSLAFLGLTVGSQAALLAFASDFVAGPGEFGHAQAVMLTLDNLCHGLFLDVFEVYDLHLTHRIEHTTVSATTFLLFRLAFDTWVLLFAYTLYQRYRSRTLFRGGPDFRSYLGVISWIRHICLVEENWYRRFPNEIVFLMIAREYLRGNDKGARTIAGQFPQVKIKKEVKALFVDDAGRCIFSS